MLFLTRLVKVLSIALPLLKRYRDRRRRKQVDGSQSTEGRSRG